MILLLILSINNILQYLNKIYKLSQIMKLVKNINEKNSIKTEVSDKEAEEAFRTILRWIGEDPSREGLIETPKRVTKAYKENQLMKFYLKLLET